MGLKPQEILSYLQVLFIGFGIALRTLIHGMVLYQWNGNGLRNKQNLSDRFYHVSGSYT